MRCEKCGNDFKMIESRHNYGFTCPKCGWAVVNRSFRNIYEGVNEYYVYLKPGNKASQQVINAVSTVAECNVMRVKTILNEGEYLLCKKRSAFISDIKQLLDEAGVLYRIVPEWNRD